MNHDIADDIAKLKHTLTQLLAHELEQFRLATGLTPSAIRTTFSDVTTHSDACSQFLLTGVHVTFTF